MEKETTTRRISSTKVSTVMLSGFVKAKGHEELTVSSDNDSSQDGLLSDSLFSMIRLIDSFNFEEGEAMQ